jgi:hypothetical protein
LINLIIRIHVTYSFTIFKVMKGSILFIFAALVWFFSCGNPKTKKSGADTTAIAETFEPRTEVKKEERVSPMLLTSGTVNGIRIEITYGAPSVKGREIWGALVPFGEVWRSGANEATIFHFHDDCKLENETIQKGKYAFYSIPGEDEWIFIFNNQWDTWGAYDYDETQDALRIRVKPQKTNKLVERMEYTMERGGFALQWEYLRLFVSVNN